MRKLLSTLFSTLQGGIRGGLLLLALITSVSTTFAHDVKIDGIYYIIDYNDATVTYRGDAFDSYNGEYSGSVVIPYRFKLNAGILDVTRIGWNAFRDCSKLTSVTIPESVKSIGDAAFWGCSSLTSVAIPNSVTSIGDAAFRECSSLSTIVVDKNNTIYDSREDCNAIIETATNTLILGCQNTTIPNSVTSIGNSAFDDCSKLTSITIPNSVTSIGDFAFWECSSLTSVTIPNSVTSIGDAVFERCSKLTSVTIGESVTSIGSWAFRGCSSLTSITIPNSVTSIGNSAFYKCSSLTSVTINSDAIVSKDYSYDDNISDRFDRQVTEYIIGDDVKKIGNYAFYNCYLLTSVTIPNSVISIGGSAFSNCSSLTKTNYTGDIAGWCNIEFASIDANPMYYSHNFYINDQEIKDLVIPNSVTSIGSYAFAGCSSLTSVTIPNSVKSIGNSAFDGCSSLTSVTIPNSVISIGNHAFAGCSSLASVTISNSVTSIGSYAFSDCSSLTSVTIPSRVTSIGDYAFYHCSSLTSVTCEAETPPTVGQYAFDGVSKSIPIYVPCGCVEAYKAASSWKDFTNIQEQLAEYSIEVDVNNNIMGTAKVDINSSCGAQISATPNFGYHFVQWSDGVTDNPRTLILTQDTTFTAEFAQTFSGQCGDNLYWELIETTLHITGSGTMYNYTSDTAPWKLLVSSINSLTIAEDVTSIDRSAFSNCPALESVVWNAKNYTNPTNKEVAPFYDICSQIKSFTFGENVEHIPAYLCYGMDKLTSVTTPNSLKTIGTSAFEGCARLSKISLGTGLEKIAANAFAGCTRLYDIYVYATYPPFTEESSFANYNVYVYIPCEYQRDYILDVVWGKFKFIECIESEDVTTNGNVTIVPGYNDVTITWPTEDNADTYTIIIKKGNEVFCTLTFNAEGQLLNIAFAPGRNGNHPAQYAEQATNGYRFTVTGLEEGMHYTYNIDVRDASNKTIKSHSGEFTTQSTTAVDNITTNNANIQKMMRNGQLIILRNGVEYNAMGQEL